MKNTLRTTTNPTKVEQIKGKISYSCTTNRNYFLPNGGSLDEDIEYICAKMHITFLTIIPKANVATIRKSIRETLLNRDERTNLYIAILTSDEANIATT